MTKNPNLALPRIHVNSSTKGKYKGLELSAPPARENSLNYKLIKTIGIEAKK
jgi:hypothetical protein